MSAPLRYPGLALGGGDLFGDKLVKLVYFDEAGTGLLQNDPDLVVAGVMIDADRQYVGLRAYLRDMLDDYTPKGLHRPRCLHAKDIFHGTKDFRGEAWEKVRGALMADLAKVPQVWDLPLFGAAVDRAGAAKELDLTAKFRDLNCYTISAGTSILQVEGYMRQHVPDEVTQITFEDVGKLRTRVKASYKFLTAPDEEFLRNASNMAPDCLPVERIIDTPTYQGKTDSSILQIADFCAFAAKRMLRNAPGYEAIFDPIAPYFIDFSYGYGEENPHAIVRQRKD